MRRRWIPALAGAGCLAVVLAGLVSGGCEGLQDPEPPGGGPELDLDYGVFVQAVEPLLAARGCSNTACHGGQGSGELMLSGGANPEADFVAVRGHVTPWEPRASPLLLKPLAVAAGGVVHGGGDVFADTTDADYATLLAWVEGEP
jgi:hypothetical protein